MRRPLYHTVLPSKSAKAEWVTGKSKVKDWRAYKEEESPPLLLDTNTGSSTLQTTSSISLTPYLFISLYSSLWTSFQKKTLIIYSCVLLKPQQAIYQKDYFIHRSLADIASLCYCLLRHNLLHLHLREDWYTQPLVYAPSLQQAAVVQM